MMCGEPFPDGLAPRKGAPYTGERTANMQRGNPVAPAERAPRHQAANEVERRPERRTRQARRDAVAVDRVDRESILQMNVSARADAVQELEGVAIAAEEHVLAVVDALAGGGIGECRRPSAERRPRLEHEDALPFLGEPRCSGEPRAAAANHNRINHARTSRAPTA